MTIRILVLAILAITSRPTVAAPILMAPVDLSVPSPDPIVITGLRPDGLIEIETRRAATAGMLRATGMFRADRSGEVNTATQAPLSGSYRGVDPLGLFWSARRDPVAPATLPAKGKVEINVRAGTAILATASSRIAPDSALLTVEEKLPFPGAFVVRPSDRRRHPVVIVLGGSEGGDSTARTYAPMFAAQGYMVVGLPYYSPDYGQADRLSGLSPSFTDIPVDRLVAVRDWLKRHPSADSSRIGLWGVSKGAEFAAIAAANYDWLTAVALIVPSDVVWEGWGAAKTTASFSVAGNPMAFVPYLGMDLEFARLGRGEQMELTRAHRAGRAAFPERIAAARIRLERFGGAVLVAGGRDDRIWPSGEMADAISLARASYGRPTVTLVYDRAGHALAGPGTDPVESYAVNGGEPEALARARAQTWLATARFFALHLLGR